MPTKSKKNTQNFENNPFFVASNGITLLFNLARGVAILFVVLSVLGLLANGLPDGTSTPKDFMSAFDGWGMAEWSLFAVATGVIGLAIIMISSLFGGVSAYASAQLSKGETVNLKDAFHEAFEKLWGFIWLEIIIFVKVVLWGLLFIIPGIVMAVRYSLASVVFFDDTKNLRGNDAVKESIRLTKNAWITTYASGALFNFLTLGAISNVVSTGVNAVLYRQYKEVGDEKPAAHWLSWLTLVLPFAVIALIIFIAVVIALVTVLLGHRAAS
jgi:hypothetical protein